MQKCKKENIFQGAKSVMPVVFYVHFWITFLTEMSLNSYIRIGSLIPFARRDTSPTTLPGWWYWPHPNLSVGHRQQDANGAELYIEMASITPFPRRILSSQRPLLYSRRGVQAVKRSKISRLILLLTSLASS